MPKADELVGGYKGIGVKGITDEVIKLGLHWVELQMELETKTKELDKVNLALKTFLENPVAVKVDKYKTTLEVIKEWREWLQSGVYDTTTPFDLEAYLKMKGEGKC